MSERDPFQSMSEPRAHSYAGDSNESFGSLVALAGRAVARLGHTEVVHRHRLGEVCPAGQCVLITPPAPDSPSAGDESVPSAASAEVVQ